MTMRRKRGFIAAVAAVLAAVAATSMAFLVSDDSCAGFSFNDDAVLDTAQVNVIPEDDPGRSAVGAGEGVAEDDPEWDCRVHGNKICGEGTD